jgi:hypothetical protein
MKPTTIVVLFAMLAIGCVPNVEEIGPEIEVRIDPENGVYASSRETAPDIELDADIMGYLFGVSVYTSSGTYDGDMDYHSVHVTSVAGSMTAGGMEIPFGTFEPDRPGDFSPTFQRTEMVMLPASVMGQALNVKMQATDENGLRSNVVDFNVALN